VDSRRRSRGKALPEVTQELRFVAGPATQQMERPAFDQLSAVGFTDPHRKLRRRCCGRSRAHRTLTTPASGMKREFVR
jgi:hypothetical protein